MFTVRSPFDIALEPEEVIGRVAASRSIAVSFKHIARSVGGRVEDRQRVVAVGQRAADDARAAEAQN